MYILEIFQILTVLLAFLADVFFILKPFGNRTDPYDLGLRYLQNNQYEDAVSSLTQAINNDPTNINAYDNRAKAFIHLGLLDKALEDAETMITEYPESNVGYRMRSRVQKELGDSEASQQDLNLAVDIEPQTAEEYQRRVSAYIELDQKKCDKRFNALDRYIEYKEVSELSTAWAFIF